MNVLPFIGIKIDSKEISKKPYNNTAVFLIAVPVSCAALTDGIVHIKKKRKNNICTQK